jgi:hypothetical protein
MSARRAARRARLGGARVQPRVVGGGVVARRRQRLRRQTRHEFSRLGARGVRVEHR